MLKTLTFALIAVFAVGAKAQPAPTHYFTVKDSIEMSWFDMVDDQDAENPRIQFSPDNRYFTIVTTRGIVRTNLTESTIWLFDTQRVASPRPLARIAVVQRVENLDTTSEEPVVSDLQWSPDSRTVLFLGENTRGKRQLYEVSVPSGLSHALTPQVSDVAQFASTRAGTIYEATPPSEPFPGGTPINADATEVTGLAMDRILFPQMVNSRAFYNDLWTLRNGKAKKLANSNPAYPLRVLNQYPDVLAPSPDGRFAVVLLAVKKAPDFWRRYDPMYAFYKIDPNNPKETSQFELHPLMEYALVDTRTGFTSPLTGAPNGHALGSWIPSSAAWSKDGKRVLLVNTYLPIAGASASERADRLHPCAAAVITLPARESSCVLFSRQQGDKASKVLSAAFGRKVDEVVVDIGSGRYTTATDQIDEHYRYDGTRWDLSATAPHPVNVNGAPLAVRVHQDLNTPPTLWAIDPATKREKKIFDPNPQLAGMNLGRVSLYRWKDSSGYEWTAGLVKPPNYMPGRRYPLVIQTYVFNRHQFMADGAFTSAYAARPLAGAGIVVLQTEYRPDHLETDQEGPDQVRGFRSAIAHLDADGLIDPKRVGIVGFSRTCYHVESALVEAPELFAAAAITDGIDFSYMQFLLYGTESFDLIGEYNAKYGTPPFGAGLSNWTGKALGFRLDRVRAPLRIEALNPSSVLGEWEIYSSLRMQKKPVDLVYIPDAQHIMRKPLDRMASQQGHVDWFRFWLQGYEDPDPSKAALYRRWESLRKMQLSGSSGLSH